MNEPRRAKDTTMLAANFTPKPALLILCALIGLVMVACHSTPTQPTASQTGSFKRYHLTGRVVSVDKQAHVLNLDSEAIPGFMGAMTMPYNVKPESLLDKLSPGDAITADVVIQGDDSWLENISVNSHTTAPPSK